MNRTLAAGLLALAGLPARADDALTPEVVTAVKRAAVYVRVEGEGWGGSGSGFVVAADAGRVLVVTNHHVAVKLPPGAPSKPPAVSVVFGSGTAAEREYPATVAAADEDRDLAVLRVAGVKDAPGPIAYADPPKPVETMSVYSFGFPLGQTLSTRKGFPAVTVGRASVSSLRDGDDGELAVIQIDGNLNPGNSGGPVVDGKGRLVGVAVARARDGQGIGFLVPAAEVGRLMAGRVGRVRVATGKGADGKPTARVEAELVDPAGAVRAATAYYVVVPPKGKAPDAASLETHPDARKLVLAVAAGKAAAALPVEKVEGSVVVQVVGDRGAGVAPVSTRPRAFSLAPGVKPEDLAGPPPAGWAEYTPPGKAFAVWLPEKPARQAAETRMVDLAGLTVRAAGVAGKTADGLTFRAETIDLPPALVRLTPIRLYPALRATLRDETKGPITDATEARSGDLGGAEFRLESGSEVTRVRVYMRTPRVYMVRVAGPADLVAAAEAESILVSFRRPEAAQAKGPDPSPVRPVRPVPPAPTEPKVVTGGKDPTILGSIEHDQKFKTLGPDGAVLVGLEVKFSKFGNTDIVRAVRPIYRVNEKEEFGKQFGSDPTELLTLKAKDGYAVGAITGKAGWWCNGFSLTYMKVKPDGTLDPKDGYESEWVGFDGRSDVIRVTGDGTPVVGVVGKVAGGQTTALGLLFRGQENFDVNPVKPVENGPDPALVGGGRDPAFKDAAPAGGLLVGVEVKVGKIFQDELVRSVRPIYRVNGKEEFGQQYGTDVAGAVTVKARDGYAVGGITAKARLACDGFGLIFMKVKPDGTLDPKDSYHGEWVGWDGHANPVRAVSDGQPVVGFVGRTNKRDVTGVGLLFKGQEGFDPAATKR